MANFSPSGFPDFSIVSSPPVKALCSRSESMSNKSVRHEMSESSLH